MSDKKFYTVAEAAEFLGVSTVTMYHYLRDGAIQGIKVNDKTWKIPVEPLRKMAGIADK